jgi:DNA polymerase III sliding clamp (beta) subunit (PCNA family)
MITVNTGQLTAAVQSAAKVAPVKGAGYESAAGIVLSYVPMTLEVKATDLDTTFQEFVDVPTGGEPFEARLPASVISGMLGTLDPSSTTTISRTENLVVVECGAVKAELNHIVGGYPEIKGFDWEDFSGTKVPDFANAIKRVAWGCGRRGDAPFDGIHFDHQGVVTTDKVSFVQLGFEMDLPGDEGITVPLSTVSAVVPRDADCKVEVADGRLRVRATHDGRTTFLTANTYAKPFPPLDKVRVWADVENSLTVDRAALLDSLRRLMALVGTERYPRVKLGIHDGELHLEITHPDTGVVSDTLPGDQIGADLDCHMDPNRLIDVARSVGGNCVIGHQGEPMKPLAFSGTEDDGFLCVAMPMAAVSGTP